MDQLTATPRVVCAWCGMMLSDGADPTSHGICERCAKTLAPDVEDLRQALIDHHFDALQRSASWWAKAAQDHGSKLVGEHDAWLASSRTLVNAEIAYRMRSDEARRAISRLMHNPEVVDGAH